mgnify:CR=1 FL=1
MKHRFQRRNCGVVKHKLKFGEKFQCLESAMKLQGNNCNHPGFNHIAFNEKEICVSCGVSIETPKGKSFLKIMP